MDHEDRMHLLVQADLILSLMHQLESADVQSLAEEYRLYLTVWPFRDPTTFQYGHKALEHSVALLEAIVTFRQAIEAHWGQAASEVAFWRRKECAWHGSGSGESCAPVDGKAGEHR